MISNLRRNLPRILIADDHTLVAEACRKLLESDYEIVATVGDGRALVRAVAELRPQLIIVDVSMPLLNGLDAGQQAKELLPSVKLIFLTMNHDADLAAGFSSRRFWISIEDLRSFGIDSGRSGSTEGEVLPLTRNRERNRGFSPAAGQEAR